MSNYFKKLENFVRRDPVICILIGGIAGLIALVITLAIIYTINPVQDIGIEILTPR